MDKKDQKLELQPLVTQKYKGRNKFIKTLISFSSMTYYQTIDKKSHDLVIAHKDNPFKRIAGIKLNELGENNIELYLIAVDDRIRNKGLGTKIIEFIINCSNNTGYTITLTPSNIHNANYDDVIGSIAISKKNKIKVNDLKKWYEKFGFVTKGKDKEGKLIMEYTPAP
jgi:GNAT superfamily N-acetyltransferase